MNTMMLRRRVQGLLILLLLGCTAARTANAQSTLPHIAAQEASPAREATVTSAPTPITFNVPILYKGFKAINEEHWYSLKLNRQYRCKLEFSGYNPTIQVSLYGPNSSTRLVSQYTISVTQPTTILLPAIGPGQYYLKIQLAPGTTQTMGGYNFCLRDTTVNPISLRINNGAVETTSRQVMLTCQCAYPPAYYKASLSNTFYDTGWLPWKNQIPFKLNAGNEVKNVYFKVWYGDANETEAISAAVVLKETVPLTIGAEWKTGCIQFQREIDWYRFIAPVAGTYLVETQCGSLGDTVMEILDANGRQLMTANDSGEEYGARIYAPLAAGKYQVRIYSHFMWETGTYSIRVQRTR